MFNFERGSKVVQQQLKQTRYVYILACIAFCGLYFVRDILGIGISYYMIYLTGAVAIWLCTKEESIAFILAMLAFQNAGYNGIFSIMILVVIVIKFRGMIRRMKAPFLLLSSACVYELLHYIAPGGASSGEYLTYIALVMVLGILCQYPYEWLNKMLIVKSYFGFSLFFALMTLFQMIEKYGSFEALLEVGFRGEEYGELVQHATNLIANQNYLTVICSVNLGLGALIISKVKNKVPYIVGVACFILVGLLTISKMFIVILSCYAIYLVVVAYKRNFLYGILATIVCIFMFFLIFYWFGDNLLELVGDRFEQGDFSTGRVEIIEQLLSYMKAHKYTYIWGTGILNLPYCLGVAVHSSIYEIIGGWGYVGGLLAVMFIVVMLKNVKKAAGYRKIKKGLNILPLLIMLSYSITGMLFSSPGAIARLIVCIYAVGITGEKNEI